MLSETMQLAAISFLYSILNSPLEPTTSLGYSLGPVTFPLPLNGNWKLIFYIEKLKQRVREN